MKVKDLKDYLEQFPDDLELELDKNSWEDYSNKVDYLFHYVKPGMYGSEEYPACLVINN